MKMQTTDFDAIIVGARVAGSATALQLAKAGARVLLVERATEIGDTLSTHALMRPAVALLEKWGIADRLVNSGVPVVTRTEFRYGDESISIPIKPVGKIGGLIAPRRYMLDSALAEAAVSAGAELRLGTSLETVITDGKGRVVGATLRTRSGHCYSVTSSLLIGADGRQSGVANAVDAPILTTTSKGAASIFGYFDGIDNDGYRWLFSDGAQAGIIPTNDGSHCIFASCPPKQFHEKFGCDGLQALVNAIEPAVPEVADRMRSIGPRRRLMRFGGAKGHIRPAVGNGWALVGDAGYFKDPATAHGITDALMDAHRLSHTLIAGLDLGEFAARRDAIAREFLNLSAEIGDLDWTLGALKEKHARLNQLLKHETAELEADWSFLAAA